MARRFRKAPGYGRVALHYMHPTRGECRETVDDDRVLEGDHYSALAEAGVLVEVFGTELPSPPPMQAKRYPISEPPLKDLSAFRLRSLEQAPVVETPAHSEVVQSVAQVQEPVAETMTVPVKSEEVAPPVETPAVEDGKDEKPVVRKLGKLKKKSA